MFFNKEDEEKLEEEGKVLKDIVLSLCDKLKDKSDYFKIPILHQELSGLENKIIDIAQKKVIEEHKENIETNFFTETCSLYEQVIKLFKDLIKEYE